ncbi:MAG: GumC family protein [Planctomycetota bacterium]
MELKDYIRILKRRFYIILITLFISLILLVRTEKKKPQIFISSAEVIIKKPIYEDYYYMPQNQMLQGYTFSYRTRLYFLNSSIFLKKVAEKIVEKKIMDKKTDEVVNILQGSLIIDRKPNTEIIRISFKSQNPEVTYKVVDTYITTLNSFLKNLNESAISSSKQFLSSQIKKLKKELFSLKIKLKKYFNKSLAFNLTTIESKETRQLNEIASQLKSVEERKKSIKEELNRLSNNIIPEEIKMLEPDISKKFLDIKNEYEQIDLQIKEELLTKTPSHPIVANLMVKKKFLYDKYEQLQLEYNIQKENLQREAILSRKINYITQLQNLENLEYELRSKYNILRKRIFDILYKGFTKNISQYETLRFQRKMILSKQRTQNKILLLSNKEEETRKNLHDITQRYNDLLVNALLYSKPLEVLEKPGIGTAIPAGPSTYWAAYILAGLLVGLIFAYLLEFTTTKIRTQFDIKKYANVPTLVSIPKLTAQQLNPSSPFILEVFNTASILLESWTVKNSAKLIHVTSATMGEGKTFVTTNLAIALAKGGRKVLLLDLDLRKPAISKYLEIGKKDYDLYDLLVANHFNQEDIKRAITKYDDILLDILCSRRSISNSSQILKSDSFKKIIEFGRREYELVLMDSSPLNIIADGVIIANYSDGVVLVIASGAVEKADIYYTKFLLSNIGAKIIGTVLNKATYEIRPYYYYYKGYTYKYYAKKAEKSTREEV